MAKSTSVTKVGTFYYNQLIVKVFVVLAVLLFLVGGWGWWHFVHSSSKRVFLGAIDNAFQTSSFSRQTIQGATGQSLNQKVYVTTKVTPQAAGTNEIIQTGTGAFHVLTNVIGTPSSDYVRYNFVTTDQKNAQGKPQDFSSIIGLWGKNDGGKDSTSGQLYNQSVLGVLPFANLPLKQRKDIVSYIVKNNVYKTDYSKVKKSIVGGRPTYSYNVVVNAESYISLLKKFGADVGLTQLAQTNASDYKSTAPLNFQFVVDAWTQQIKKIQYTTNVREEVYGSFGINSRITKLPVNAISIQELQQKVQAIE